jgi:hypothetical protein
MIYPLLYHTRKNVLNVWVHRALFIGQPVSSKPGDVNDDLFFGIRGVCGGGEKLADSLDKDPRVLVIATRELHKPGCAAKMVKRLAKYFTKLPIDFVGSSNII